MTEIELTDRPFGQCEFDRNPVVGPEFANCTQSTVCDGMRGIALHNMATLNIYNEIFRNGTVPGWWNRSSGNRNARISQASVVQW